MMKKNAPKKTDALTLRLSPKVKFLIELCSRHDHKTITGVVENAVLMLANQRNVKAMDEEISLNTALDFCWSPDESERVSNLVLFFPTLMSHEESCIRTVLWDADDLFFSFYEVRNTADYEYREHWSNKRRGVFHIDDDGVTYFVTPRRKLIKLAWGLISKRAAELAESGVGSPLSRQEVETFIGRPIESARSNISARDDGFDEFTYGDDGFSDVVDLVTKG